VTCDGNAALRLGVTSLTSSVPTDVIKICWSESVIDAVSRSGGDKDANGKGEDRKESSLADHGDTGGEDVR
jgi:hypothetical protein